MLAHAPSHAPYNKTHGAYLRSDPPQCFDEYQCIFHRYPVENGLKDEYLWDLRPLCACAQGEYVARRDPTCVKESVTGVCPSRCPEPVPRVRRP